MRSGSARTIVGTVVSDKMDKTVMVRVKRTTRHTLYNRVISRSKKYKVHDEQNRAHPGDKVRITSCRPLSKTKRWMLVEVIK